MDFRKNMARGPWREHGTPVREGFLSDKPVSDSHRERSAKNDQGRQSYLSFDCRYEPEWSDAGANTILSPACLKVTRELAFPPKSGKLFDARSIAGLVKYGFRRSKRKLERFSTSARSLPRQGLSLRPAAAWPPAWKTPVPSTRRRSHEIAVF
jgi:hypothetical protein